MCSCPPFPRAVSCAFVPRPSVSLFLFPLWDIPHMTSAYEDTITLQNFSSQIRLHIMDEVLAKSTSHDDVSHVISPYWLIKHTASLKLKGGTNARRRIRSITSAPALRTIQDSDPLWLSVALMISSATTTLAFLLTFLFGSELRRKRELEIREGGLP